MAYVPNFLNPSIAAMLEVLGRDAVVGMVERVGGEDVFVDMLENKRDTFFKLMDEYRKEEK